MFEYHGWATIRTDVVDEYGDEDEAALELLWARLQEESEAIRQSNGVAHLDNRNGVYALSIFGHNNHRNEVAINLFRWMSDNARNSYGLLYIHDNEDYRRGNNHENVFRVWRLALGKLEELDDPFLSPYMPTVELPYTG